MEAVELRKTFAAFLGDERFGKFVATGWRRGRLRYWQEREWRRFSAARPELKAGLADLEVALRICEVHGDDLQADEVSRNHPESHRIQEFRRRSDDPGVCRFREIVELLQALGVEE